MTDIPGDERFINAEPIEKGWSNDKKYRVETAGGKRMLLRVSDISELDRKKAGYEMMERIHTLGVSTPQMFEFGLCDGGKSVYSLSEWINGQDLETVLTQMSEAEQYSLGIKAGELLRKIHTIPAPENAADWRDRYFSVIDERIDAYCSKGVPFAGSGIVLAYLERNRGLLNGRPQCFLHGDYHEGNLMITAGGELYVIDWLDEGFGNHGDPWYDFKAFGENDNAYFSTGFVRGYFGGEPPRDFWNVLTYYIVTSALTSIVWMKHHRPEELSESLRWNEKNARFLQDGRSPLTEWYLPDLYVQQTDGVHYKLKSPFDFSFLSRYGKVFKVFDDQDSGNICFGVRAGEKRYFIKFAGAPTARSCVSQEEAVERIRTNVPIYKDLAHPNLTSLIRWEEIGGGCALVFEWADAECMGRQYPATRERFMALPQEIKMKVFDDILSFHLHVIKQGYIAVDFYNGSIMYDFANGRTIICDIEFYSKTPYTNPIGRMWGSSRFMSPEEFELGAVIDEITNVYTMGATAFALFGDERDRRMARWQLSKAFFAVVNRAVSGERGKRQQSITQLMEEWKAAGK